MRTRTAQRASRSSHQACHMPSPAFFLVWVEEGAVSFFDWGEEGAVSVAPLWWSTTHNARAARDSPLSTLDRILNFSNAFKSFKIRLDFYIMIHLQLNFNLVNVHIESCHTFLTAEIYCTCDKASPCNIGLCKYLFNGDSLSKAHMRLWHWALGRLLGDLLVAGILHVSHMNMESCITFFFLASLACYLRCLQHFMRCIW